MQNTKLITSCCLVWLSEGICTIKNPQFFGSRNLVYLIYNHIYIYISACVCFLQVLLQSKSISYDGNIFQNNITVWGGRFPSRVLADPLAQQVGPPAAVPEAKNRWAKAWWVVCSISPGCSCFCFCLWWCYVVVVVAAGSRGQRNLNVFEQD